MRNLEITSLVCLPPSSLLEGASSGSFCIDEDAGLWFATAAGNLCRISPTLEVSVEIALVDCGHVTKEDYIIGMEYLPDGVYVATRNGDILLCNPHSKHVEVVGSVEGGLQTMSWSPDQELVVFCTRNGNLLLMTRQLDLTSDDVNPLHDLVPVTEVPMSPSEFGKAEPVTVGWGKKSTQFHGSAGKQSAQEKPVQAVSSAHSWDDLRPRVSWPEDGEYFVCGSIDAESGNRRLRVWTREGDLLSTSEVTEGLEQCLNWRPSGNLITSSQCLPHIHQIVFFEKNGLRHGEFSLRVHNSWQDGKCVVRELGWNSDSTVLFLWLEERRDNPAVSGVTSDLSSPPKSSIQLWTRGNYHWYLKQELFSPLTPDSTPSARLAVVQWDIVEPLHLHVLTSDGCYVTYELKWCVNKSSCLSEDNHCDVIVIDGDRLFLTPFRHVSTPPPMRTHTLSLPSPVLSVSHAPPPRVNNFLVAMATGEVAVYGYNNRGAERVPPYPKPERIGITRLPMTTSLVRQLCWAESGRLVGVVWDSATLRDSVVEFELTMEVEKIEIVFKCSHVLPPSSSSSSSSSILSLASHPDTGSTVAQTTEGTLLRYSTSDGLLPWKLTSGIPLNFPSGPCHQMTITSLHDKEHLIALDEFRHILYVNDRKIATGVTTFDLHNEFLIYTTDSHECHFLRTTSFLVNSDLNDRDVPKLIDEGKRKVERGSKIVAVVPHSSKLILQMPRGNLETINPRPLVLSIVRCHLNHHRYGDAFLTMRINRINLNFMYDHNPQEFLSHIEEFVKQLETVAHINLFLTELSEEDTTKAMYPPSEGGGGGGGGGKKVDQVCEAVRRILISLDENKYLLSIITVHVRKSEPELESVLLRIKHLSQQEQKQKEEEDGREGGGGGRERRVTADEALKYVLFLVNVDRLYDDALGMYDFQLVLMVAEKSQKDPKEYLPFLNSLRKLSGPYQKYRIDLHLQRYHKALLHISQCCPDRFEECLTLIKEHSLYSHALEIFSDKSSQEYETIACCYGNHLSEQKDYKSAAIVFFRCERLKESLENFEMAGDWQMTFALSAQLGHDRGQRAQLARRMATTLKSQRQYSAAAILLTQYAEDVEEAVVVLADGGLWREALRIANLHHRRDLIETNLKPQLLESCGHHLSLLPSLSSDLTRHSTRLRLLREQKLKKEEAILDGTYTCDDRDTDLFSDISSVTGRSATSSSQASSSRMSGKSRKNRRKASHKKWSLREGSRHEDLALMEAITELCSTVDHLQDEIPSLLQTLLLYDHTHEAKQLHSAFSDLIDSAKSAVEKAWPKATPTSHQTPLTGPHTTVNSMLASMATTVTTVTSGDQPKLGGGVGDHQLTGSGGQDVMVEFPKPRFRDIAQDIKLSLIVL